MIKRENKRKIPYEFGRYTHEVKLPFQRYFPL